MEFAIWSYPWNLVDEGVERAAKRLERIGIDELTLATNYHAVQTYHPRETGRSTFFARASSYFQPTAEYGRLEPVPNERMDEDDWLAEIADGIADTSLALNSWTVGCHDSRLGMANRDLALENPYGDRLVFGLCPSKPAVQRYLTALVADLDTRTRFGRIELEQFDYFCGTGFGWHHQKIHVVLGDLGEFLFGLCFCEACRANAADAGIDVERARTECVETLDAIAAEDRSDVDPAAWLMHHPTVRSYVRVRCETLGDVFADLRREVDADLGYYLPNLAPENAWKYGADPDRLAASLDHHVALAYGSNRTEIVDCVRTARSLTDIPVHAGVLAGHPAIEDQATLVDVVEGLASAGVERVSFYNDGLLPERSLDWIDAATEPHR
jgi:hypothetical protein